MQKELVYCVDHGEYEMEIEYILDYEHMTRDSPGYCEIEVTKVNYYSKVENDPKKCIDFTEFYFDYISDCFDYDLEQHAKDYIR